MLKALGADAVIFAGAGDGGAGGAFRAEIVSGVDVVLDYLWGSPAESVLAAIAAEGVEPLESADTVCAGGEQRGGDDHAGGSYAAELGGGVAGSGFGALRLRRSLRQWGSFSRRLRRGLFDVEIKAVALKDVEAVWGGEREGCSGCVSALRFR